MVENIDPHQIQNLEDAKQIIILLLNLFEEQIQGNKLLQEKMQQMQDEINRLKGEQEKPKIQKDKAPSSNISSENRSEEVV